MGLAVVVVATTGTGGSSSFLEFLATDQITADAAEIFLCFFDDVSRLGALLERTEHQGDPGLGVKMGTCALVSEVGDSAEAAVFDASQFQRTVPDRVDLVACNAGRGAGGSVCASVESWLGSDFGWVDSFEWTLCDVIS